MVGVGGAGVLHLVQSVSDLANNAQGRKEKEGATTTRPKREPRPNHKFTGPQWVSYMFEPDKADEEGDI